MSRTTVVAPLACFQLCSKQSACDQLRSASFFLLALWCIEAVVLGNIRRDTTDETEKKINQNLLHMRETHDDPMNDGETDRPEQAPEAFHHCRRWCACWLVRTHLTSVEIVNFLDVVFVPPSIDITYNKWGSRRRELRRRQLGWLVFTFASREANVSAVVAVLWL